MLHYWEEQAEQDVVKLPVDGTISNPVSAVTEEITVVLNENETRMLLQETLSIHRVQINEVLLAALVQVCTAADIERRFRGTWSRRDY